jgi:hypothetical protein
MNHAKVITNRQSVGVWTYSNGTHRSITTKAAKFSSLMRKRLIIGF